MNVQRRHPANFPGHLREQSETLVRKITGESLHGFIQVAAEYARASDVNGRRLYAETMEQVLPKIRKLIVDNNGNLDLTIIRKGETAK